MQVNINTIRKDVENLIKNFQGAHTFDSIKHMNYQMAVGQSGKGSVFGSIFISLVWWPRPIKSQIQRLRLDEKLVQTIDKKQQKAFRQQIFRIINLLKNKYIFFETIELTASQISSTMNNLMVHYNLNQIVNNSVDKICKIPFKDHFKVTHIFSKCFGPNDQGRIRLNLSQYSDIIQSIKVQSKSEGTYSLTNMANLIARALNEKTLNQWKFKEQTYFDEKFGSGGTSDQVTIKWLQQNKHHVFGYPDIVRFSWVTVTKSLEGTLAMKVNEGRNEDEKYKMKYLMGQNYKDTRLDIWNLPQLNKKQ